MANWQCQQGVRGWKIKGKLKRRMNRYKYSETQHKKKKKNPKSIRENGKAKERNKRQRNENSTRVNRIAAAKCTLAREVEAIKRLDSGRKKCRVREHIKTKMLGTMQKCNPYRPKKKRASAGRCCLGRNLRQMINSTNWRVSSCGIFREDRVKATRLQS